MPFEISNEQEYLLLRVFGVVSRDELQELVRRLHEFEDTGPPMNRVVDLTAIETLDVGFPDVQSLADIRRKRSFAAPIRSAFIAQRPLQIGYARMFQMLNDNPAIRIRIFASMAEGVAWLAQ